MTGGNKHYLVQAQFSSGFFGDLQVADVRRIESSAEKAASHQ